jgi:hypothetical protein
MADSVSYIVPAPDAIGFAAIAMRADAKKVTLMKSLLKLSSLFRPLCLAAGVFATATAWAQTGPSFERSSTASSRPITYTSRILATFHLMP